MNIIFGALVVYTYSSIWNETIQISAYFNVLQGDENATPLRAACVCIQNDKPHKQLLYILDQVINSYTAKSSLLAVASHIRIISRQQFATAKIEYERGNKTSRELESDATYLWTVNSLGWMYSRQSGNIWTRRDTLKLELDIKGRRYGQN